MHLWASCFLMDSGSSQTTVPRSWLWPSSVQPLHSKVKASLDHPRTPGALLVSLPTPSPSRMKRVLLGMKKRGLHRKGDLEPKCSLGNWGGNPRQMVHPRKRGHLNAEAAGNQNARMKKRWGCPGRIDFGQWGGREWQMYAGGTVNKPRPHP